MAGRAVHACGCPGCRQDEEHADREWHRQMNLLLSRLDEQQRRWYVAVEAERLGYGGIVVLGQITGMDDKTIRRGRQELARSLADRPVKRMRLPGGGRPPVEKKRWGAAPGAGGAGGARDGG
ncbi:MAG TPA: hypothetical protein VIU62_15705 [Chloroflexota bacterium]